MLLKIQTSVGLQKYLELPRGVHAHEMPRFTSSLRKTIHVVSNSEKMERAVFIELYFVCQFGVHILPWTYGSPRVPGTEIRKFLGPLWAPP